MRECVPVWVLCLVYATVVSSDPYSISPLGGSMIRVSSDAALCMTAVPGNGSPNVLQLGPCDEQNQYQRFNRTESNRMLLTYIPNYCLTTSFVSGSRWLTYERCGQAGNAAEQQFVPETQSSSATLIHSLFDYTQCLGVFAAYGTVPQFLMVPCDSGLRSDGMEQHFLIAGYSPTVAAGFVNSCLINNGGCPSGYTCQAVFGTVPYTRCGCARGSISNGMCLIYDSDFVTTCWAGWVGSVYCEAATVGGLCSVPCGYGNVLQGYSGYCSTSGKWVDYGTCVPSGCSSPPANPANGYYNCPTTVPNAQYCPLVCNANYVKTGSDPQCSYGSYLFGGGAQSCELSVGTACTSLPAAIANGHYECYYASSGSRCPLMCDNGYASIGGEPMCNSGVWAYYGGYCYYDGSCHSLPSDPAHGSTFCSVPVASGTTCSVQCFPGYTFQGTLPMCASGLYSTDFQCVVDDSGTDETTSYSNHNGEVWGMPIWLVIGLACFVGLVLLFCLLLCQSAWIKRRKRLRGEVEGGLLAGVNADADGERLEGRPAHGGGGGGDGEGGGGDVHLDRMDAASMEDLGCMPEGAANAYTRLEPAGELAGEMDNERAYYDHALERKQPDVVAVHAGGWTSAHGHTQTQLRTPLLIGEPEGETGIDDETLYSHTQYPTTTAGYAQGYPYAQYVPATLPAAPPTLTALPVAEGSLTGPITVTGAVTGPSSSPVAPLSASGGSPLLLLHPPFSSDSPAASTAHTPLLLGLAASDPSSMSSVSSMSSSSSSNSAPASPSPYIYPLPSVLVPPLSLDRVNEQEEDDEKRSPLSQSQSQSGRLSPPAISISSITELLKTLHAHDQDVDTDASAAAGVEGIIATDTGESTVGEQKRGALEALLRHLPLPLPPIDGAGDSAVHLDPVARTANNAISLQQPLDAEAHAVDTPSMGLEVRTGVPPQDAIPQDNGDNATADAPP